MLNFIICDDEIHMINSIARICLSNNCITFKNDDVCYIGLKYKNTFMEVIDYDTVLM